MPTVQDCHSSRKPPLIDPAGNHLQYHGNPAEHCSPSAMRRLGVPVCMQVMTRCEGRQKKGPEVVLYVADAPFAFDWRMTATEARTLADNLLQAANTADQVAAAHLKRAKRKAGV